MLGEGWLGYIKSSGVQLQRAQQELAPDLEPPDSLSQVGAPMKAGSPAQDSSLPYKVLVVWGTFSSQITRGTIVPGPLGWDQ